jgi:deoxyribonuclease (pyrimidine dimer)
MARVNVGLSPKLLSDQHLVAESVEITMITGNLRMNGYKLKTPTPTEFSLGKGHMNFFKDKLGYLHKRLSEVNSEMIRRGFRPGTHINLEEFPAQLRNDWKPSHKDTKPLRERVADRLLNPKNGKKGNVYHRYEGKVIGEGIKHFHNNILNSELYYV